jgi:hypothetical protein
MEDAASYLRKNYTNFKINDFYDKCGTIDQQQSEKIFKDAILKIINQPNESGWRDFAKNQHGRNYPVRPLL